ncbi:MAG TPA: riboflavin synthase [Cytophaga sp.]|jgi:riboflavin synthase|nr:riboflavin synthase [Cytophaga sp.]
MFTGIIESLGHIEKIVEEQGNLHFTVRSTISHELKIDQSLSHNGICLTVVALDDNTHTVTAIQETIRKTSISEWKQGMHVNLERAMPAHGRFDGHIVQGHVDQVALCTQRKDDNGSWLFTFQYDASSGNITVEKGSICVNGISLTVVDSKDDAFSVAIIPYTFEHTSLKECVVGSNVNIEFDILGKYAAKLLGRK